MSKFTLFIIAMIFLFGFFMFLNAFVASLGL